MDFFLSYVNVIKLSGHKSITHFMWCDRLSIASVDSRKNQVEELQTGHLCYVPLMLCRRYKVWRITNTYEIKIASGLLGAEFVVTLSSRSLALKWS